MINNKSINLITNKTDSGKRIDQFISQNTELSRQRISKLIKDGYVSVNEEVITIKKNKIRGDIEKIKIILPQLLEDTLKPENISLNILSTLSDLLKFFSASLRLTALPSLKTKAPGVDGSETISKQIS